MFLMIGGGEKAGSGFDTIQTGWTSQHWRAPGLVLFNHPDRVRLVLSMTSLIPETVLMELQQRFGTQFAKLGELEVQALVTAQIEGEVSNIRLQELAVDHPVEITQILQGLCSKKMLVSDNRRRWARYKLPPKVATPTSLVGYGKGNSPHLDGNLSHLNGNLSHLNGNLSHLNGNLSHLNELDQELAGIVISVPSKKKLSKLEKRSIILRLCKGRYLSVEQIASLLKRNRRGLRARDLASMVDEGLLQMRYPDTPNRPDQAYTAC
jgi:ATP-dependent DNA helicase RecG